MFWDSMWDDKHNYTKLLNENVFIHQCIPLIFDDNLSKNLILYAKKNSFLNLNKEKYQIFHKNNNRFNIYKFFKKEKSLSFLSKTWILRYHSWLILYVFLYSSKNNFFNNFNFIMEEKNESWSEENADFYYSYNNIYNNYFLNLNKLNYDNNYFFKHTNKCFVF